MSKRKLCSICNEPMRGGASNDHNADPYPGRCCSWCNGTIMIPARFALSEILERGLQKDVVG